MRRWPSVEKAERLLGWKARIGVEEGIAATVAWLREREERGELMPSALITGITGQDGSYLAELLLEKGYEVHGMVRRASTEKFDRIEHLRDRITLHQADLLDQRSLVDALRAAKPGRGLQPRRDVVRRRVLDPADADRRVHRRRRHADARGGARDLPGGALLPGVLERDVRQGARDAADRDDAVLPALAVRRGEGLRPPHHGQLPRVLRPVRRSGILFNHESQRRGLEFVTRKITWHAAAIKLGQRDKLALGNLDARRDWGYAKDYVEAMWLMLQHDEPDDFVIATGETNTVRRCVEIAFDEAGLEWEPHVEIDDAFKRPAEVDLLVGDATQGQARARLGAEDELRGADPADGALRPRAAVEVG